jgi:hypothetical protein
MGGAVVASPKEAALDFFKDELRERVADLYGVAPTIEFVEIAQFVDNSGAYSSPAPAMA